MTDTQTRPAVDDALASFRIGTVTAVETTTVSLQASSALAVHGARGKHTGIGPFPSDIIGHHYYDVDILKEPAPIDGRVARLPDGPGLGVEPGPEVIARFG